MTFLTIYLLTSLGFGINNHVNCEKEPVRVMTKKECKILGYVSAPLFPVFIYASISDKIRSNKTKYGKE